VTERESECVSESVVCTTPLLPPRFSSQYIHTCSPTYINTHSHTHTLTHIPGCEVLSWPLVRLTWGDTGSGRCPPPGAAAGTLAARTWLCVHGCCWKKEKRCEFRGFGVCAGIFSALHFSIQLTRCYSCSQVLINTYSSTWPTLATLIH
jgi:hypothetical protein